MSLEDGALGDPQHRHTRVDLGATSASKSGPSQSDLGAPGPSQLGTGDGTHAGYTNSENASQPARKIIVAIDGPAGAGKSTVARHLARHFGLLNLETGAMYRAFALKALREELPLDDSSGLERLAKETTIRLEANRPGTEAGEADAAPGQQENRVFLDDEDVTGLIRNQTVTDAASRVSVFPAIRAWMVRMQQQLGAGGGVVMEGRDIGTVVFPHAEVKIFLDAAPEVRGLRRFDQMGPAPLVQPEEVIRELRARDERDRNRPDSPLKPAADAVLLDSTHMTLEQAVEAAEGIVASKLRLAAIQS